MSTKRKLNQLSLSNRDLNKIYNGKPVNGLSDEMAQFIKSDMEKYSDGSWSVHGHPFVPKEKVKSKIRQIYRATRFNGIQSLYNYIAQDYYGITRKDVEEFLKTQPNYIIHQKRTKPVLSSKPFKHIQIDLIDMRNYKSPKNKQVAWLFSAIDIFSRYAFVFGIPNKSSRTIAKNINKIFFAIDDIENELKHYNPKYPNLKVSIIQSDNGAEFKNNKSYTPQSQGIIERFNGTLKKRIMAYMSFTNSRSYMDELDNIVDAYNNSKHSTTGFTPIEVVINPELWPVVQSRLNDKARI